MVVGQHVSLPVENDAAAGAFGGNLDEEEPVAAVARVLMLTTLRLTVLVDRPVDAFLGQQVGQFVGFGGVIEREARRRRGAGGSPFNEGPEGGTAGPG